VAGYNYIAISPRDFTDGISATLIPKGPTTNVLGGFRFAPATECPRLRFTCSGTSFSVRFARDSVFVGVTDYNDCAVFVDGAYAGKITPTVSTVAWYASPAMAAGNHVVELQGGQGQVGGASNYLSTGHILAIAGTNLQLAPVVASRKLVCFQDSILCANSGTGAIGETDLFGLLRGSYPGRVTAEAMGSATYTMWSDITSTMKRFARHAAGATLVDLLFALGVNDYIGSVANITPALTTLLTSAVTLPNLNKLVILTPITKGTETVNGAGFTLGDVRNQIVAAATAVASPKIVVVDGTTLNLNTSTDYEETPASNALHPNDLGQPKLLAGIRVPFGF
jgi:hypothetical protein